MTTEKKLLLLWLVPYIVVAILLAFVLFAPQARSAGITITQMKPDQARTMATLTKGGHPPQPSITMEPERTHICQVVEAYQLTSNQRAQLDCEQYQKAGYWKEKKCADPIFPYDTTITMYGGGKQVWSAHCTEKDMPK